MTTIADLFTKYNCTNCQDDIQGIRVHCTECENFYLCLQVSIQLRGLFMHRQVLMHLKNTHAHEYIIIYYLFM